MWREQVEDYEFRLVVRSGQVNQSVTIFERESSLDGAPEETQRQGRSRNRWKDGHLADLQTTTCVTE